MTKILKILQYSMSAILVIGLVLALVLENWRILHLMGSSLVFIGIGMFILLFYKQKKEQEQREKDDTDDTKE